MEPSPEKHINGQKVFANKFNPQTTIQKLPIQADNLPLPRKPECSEKTHLKCSEESLEGKWSEGNKHTTGKALDLQCD